MSIEETLETSENEDELIGGILVGREDSTGPDYDVIEEVYDNEDQYGVPLAGGADYEPPE